MRDVGSLERPEHLQFTTQRVVRPRAEVAGPATEHEFPTAAAKAQHDVLRASPERADVLQRPVAEALFLEPFRQTLQVDSEIGRGSVARRAHSEIPNCALARSVSSWCM